MRPFRHYDPQEPGQQDSGTIVHHRSLSPLMPLGLIPDEPIGEVGWRNGTGPFQDSNLRTVTFDTPNNGNAVESSFLTTHPQDRSRRRK